MSRLFGDVRQMGYVVRDLDAAMKHWVNVMQVGPFFRLERPKFFDYRYHGQPAELWVNAGFAQCGDIQIELIQQMNDAPSMYRDFLAAGREGLQHIAFWRAPGDYETALAAACASGMTVAMSAASVEPEGRLVYFDQEAHPGTVIELSCVTPGKKRVFDHVASAAHSWNGSNPIRSFD